MALKASSPLAARQRQVVQVGDMTGGLDQRRDPTLLGPNRARQLTNYSLEQPGALVVRPGFQAASSASFGSNPQGGVRAYLASTVFSLVAFDGAVYKPTDGWVQGASVLSGLSTNNQIYFPYDRTVAAVMDAVHRPYMSTSGSSFVLMGIDAPSSAATLSSVSTGGLTSGEYAIAYTYKHRGTAAESNGSAESTITIAASSGAINATASPSTDGKVDAYVWYARHKTPDGESVLRKVSSGAASTVTITSSNWTSNDEIPTINNAPVAGLRFAAVWKNRWWAPDGTVTNRLRFTELFLNQTWPSNYYIDIPFEKGDSIAALQALGDTLLVFGQSGIFLIIGQTSLDFEVRPSQGAIFGAYGPRSVTRVEQSIVHLSNNDVSGFDGATDRSMAYDIQPTIRDLAQNVSGATLATCAAAYDPLRKELRLALPRVYPTGAHGEMVLNLDRTREDQGEPAWSPTDWDVFFYIPWDGNEPTAGNRNRLFFVNSTGGYIWEANVDVGANSSNMTAEYDGPTLNFGLHRSRVLGGHVEYEPHGGAFSVEVLTDGVSQGVQTINIGAGIAQYGTATYGTATYAGASRKKAYFALPVSAEGQTAQVKTVYTGKERFKYFGYALEILPEPEARRL